MRTRTIPADPPPSANGTATPPPSPNGTNGGRDPATGKFTRGNGGGPGNPFGRRLAKLRWAFVNAVTDELMGDFARQLVAQAARGDMAAAVLFLRYSIGEPVPAPDPDHVDLDELQLLRKCSREASLRGGTELIDPGTAVVALKALMRAGLRRCLADGQLSDVFARAGVREAFEALGLGGLVDEAAVLRARLAGKSEDPS
jgi:hypothetical protein